MRLSLLRRWAEPNLRRQATGAEVRALHGIDFVVSQNGIGFGLHVFEHGDEVLNPAPSCGAFVLFDLDLNDQLLVRLRA